MAWRMARRATAAVQEIRVWYRGMGHIDILRIGSMLCLSGGGVCLRLTALPPFR
jgi:hypothetical protein